MRVLHIIASVDPEDGGPIEGIKKLDEILHLNGIDTELLTLDHAEADCVKDYVGIVHAKGRLAPAGTGLFARLRRWARQSPEAVDWARSHIADYDAAVVHGLWNYSTRVAALALGRGNTPYVVYSHGMLDPWFRRQYPLKHLAKQILWFLNEGPLLRRANRMLFTCEQERMLARQTFWPYQANEQVVAFGASGPLPFDPSQEAEFRALLPALGNRNYLLFLSRIHEKKGCDLLVKAFAAIADEAPELDLVIAGPDRTGLRPHLEGLARQGGVAHRIHWPGMITGAAKYGALRGAEAFVLPSHQENFGIAVAEALACAKPVLISDQVNIFREIAEARAGFTETDSVEGTINLLRRWLKTDAAERAEMGRRAEALYHDRFTVEAAARDLCDVLHEITKK